MSQFSNHFRLLILSVLICCPSLFAGCSGPPSEPVGTLTGIITSNGELLVPDCRARAYHAKTETTKAVIVSDEGRYTFKDFPIGDYKLAVQPKPSYGAQADPYDNRVPDKYRSINTSGFEFTIKEGMNEYDLKLEY